MNVLDAIFLNTVRCPPPRTMVLKGSTCLEHTSSPGSPSPLGRALLPIGLGWLRCCMWMTLLSFTPATQPCVQARANKLDAQFAHMRASRRWWLMAATPAAHAIDEVHPLGQSKCCLGEHSTAPQSGAPKTEPHSSRATRTSRQLGHKRLVAFANATRTSIYTYDRHRTSTQLHASHARSHGRPSASTVFLRPSAHPAH